MRRFVVIWTALPTAARCTPRMQAIQGQGEVEPGDAPGNVEFLDKATLGGCSTETVFRTQLAQ